MLNGIRICALVLAAALSWTPMAEAQDQDQVYGVLMKTLSNPFWGAMEEGVRDGASEIGVDYFLQAVESDQAAEPQLNTCMTMLERNPRSEEHTSEIQSLMRNSYAVFCLKKKIPYIHN